MTRFVLIERRMSQVPGPCPARGRRPLHLRRRPGGRPHQSERQLEGKRRGGRRLQ